VEISEPKAVGLDTESTRKKVPTLHEKTDSDASTKGSTPQRQIVLIGETVGQVEMEKLETDGFLDYEMLREGREGGARHSYRPHAQIDEDGQPGHELARQRSSPQKTSITNAMMEFRTPRSAAVDYLLSLRPTPKSKNNLGAF
jgi:hypothetical protein